MGGGTKAFIFFNFSLIYQFPIISMYAVVFLMKQN